MHHDFDSLGVTFHPVVVIGLGKNFLFKSVLAHCDLQDYDTFKKMYRFIYLFTYSFTYLFIIDSLLIITY